MQFVLNHEACEFLQSGEATGKKLCKQKMQSLRLSTVLLLRQHSSAPEALAIHLSSVPMAALLMRSRETSVQQI